MVVIEEQSAKDASFPGMDPGEEFRLYFRRHSIRLWWSIGTMIVWTLAGGALVYMSGVYEMTDIPMARVIVAALCLFFIMSQMVFLTRVYEHYLRVVVITDRKIHQFKRTLLIVDRHESVDIHVLQDIDKSQRGIIQTLCGYGSLKLEAQNSRMIIHFTPRIDDVYNEIVRMREIARHRMTPGTGPKDMPVQPS